MGPTAESIAHFVHGVVTAYFLTWTIFIWNLRKQSNMMYMLFPLGKPLSSNAS